jgi:hypothetical protein
MTTVRPANTTDVRCRHRIETERNAAGAARELAAIARDDQQRVVDSDAETDHRQRRSLAQSGTSMKLASKLPAARPTPTPNSAVERQTHRHERPERDQQHDGGDEQAGPFRSDAA